MSLAVMLRLPIDLVQGGVDAVLAVVVRLHRAPAAV
jgi:hypothetical protein